MMQGTVFDLARFCLHDGPGIRTTVFLKGCPLRCSWCHNPESQSTQPEILFAKDRCIGCGICAQVCPFGCHKTYSDHFFDRSFCAGCGRCSEACPTNALRLAGRPMSTEDILQVVRKDRIYYEESGGGLTVSGGEPLMQADFLEELLRLAKQEGLNTCVETCGYAAKDTFEKILPYTDCFLYDWKETNTEKHKQFTGKGNSRILDNLTLLSSRNAEIILRVPLIPGYNNTDEHTDGIVALANNLNGIRKIEIMPYHPLGLSKTDELDRQQIVPPPDIPSQEFLSAYRNKLAARVFADVVISG